MAYKQTYSYIFFFVYYVWYVWWVRNLIKSCYQRGFFHLNSHHFRGQILISDKWQIDNMTFWPFSQNRHSHRQKVTFSTAIKFTFCYQMSLRKCDSHQVKKPLGEIFSVTFSWYKVTNYYFPLKIWPILHWQFQVFSVFLLQCLNKLLCTNIIQTFLQFTQWILTLKNVIYSPKGKLLQRIWGQVDKNLENLIENL